MLLLLLYDFETDNISIFPVGFGSSGAGHGCGKPGRHLQVNRSLTGRHSASPQGRASHAWPQLPTFTPPNASANIPICNFNFIYVICVIHKSLFYILLLWITQIT